MNNLVFLHSKNKTHMSKLWQTTYTLDTLIEDFTVGDDPIIDLTYLPYDIQATIAHAKMLTKI